MRRAVGIWALGVEAVSLVLFYASMRSWPWEAAALVSVLALVVATRSGLLRTGWVRWTVYGVVAVGGGILPWGTGSGAGPAAWFIASVAFEVYLGAWVWVYFRRQFVRPDPLAALLGKTGALGLNVVIPGEDRFLHLHVVGPTGSGKTEGVLWPLIRQDLVRQTGVTVLDPKGGLAARTAAEARSQHRAVTALGPDEPFAFNPLAGGAKGVAQAFVDAMERVFPVEDTFFRNLGQTLLRQSILALKGVPGEDPGIDDLIAFLGDEDVRRKALLKTRDETALAYFRREYANWTARARNEYTLGLRNALMALVQNDDVHRMMGGSGVLDLGGILSRGEVLTAALPLGRLGDSGRVFGAYLLARLQASAIGRPAGAPHFLYLDEFQQFASPAFAQFLELAREDRVGATLAHQNLAQLPPHLRSSVLANARNRLLLGGLSAEDLDALQDTLGSRVGVRVTEGPSGESRTLIREPRFAPDMMRHLPRGRAVAQVMQGGRVLEPRLVSLPKPVRP